MAGKKGNCYSGIGGQAVLEGIMMKNGDKYATAVRKANGEIAVEPGSYSGVLHGWKLRNIPFIRGIFSFIDSMILGGRCLNDSAVYYEEEPDAEDQGTHHETLEKIMTVGVTLVSVVLALGIFVALPYYIASLLEGYIRNSSLLLILEGVVRILIFIVYVLAITLMKDIRRLFAYHGAEHKCINCVERGRPLTVKNVMRSSRLHKRCGTSFIFFVLLVSIILFFFIRVDNVVWRLGLRILLMPVIAGISYELIRMAGKSDFILWRILSAPGMFIQRLTTREPDEQMCEVAIAAVEAVFDWRAYLRDNFGYEDIEGMEE